MASPQASEPTSSRARPIPLSLAVGAVLAGGLAARALGLGNLPGVNGDEAWYAVNQAHLLSGGPGEWRTPSGNPLNPFFSGLYALEHLLGVAPSFWALRIPAALCGLLAVALCYPALRRPLGPRAALIAAVLAAGSPPLIAYSRIAWDSSQVPLASLACVAFAFRRKYVLLALSLAAAVLIHPTSIFLTPAVLSVLLPDLARWLRAPDRWRGARWVLAAGVTAASAALFLAARRWWPLPDFSLLADRLLSPEGWASFGLGFLRVLSGRTVCEYFVGPPEDSLAIALDVAALLLAATACAGAWRLARSRRWDALGLGAGLLLSLAALYLVGGLKPVTANAERYSLALCLPFAVFLACAMEALAPRERPFAATAVACAASLLLLAGFAKGYFANLLADGGNSELTFRTGPVEPKQEILEAALGAREPGRDVVLLVDDHFDYWPLKYLALNERGIHVEPAFSTERLLTRAGELAATGKVEVLAAGWFNGIFAQVLPTFGPGAPVLGSHDFAGAPVLLLWDLSGRAPLPGSPHQ